MSSRRVGFFGGTFDPIHFGHLNLALSILEAKNLDEVIFCPANVSPFKGQNPPMAPNEHRREMLLLALGPIEQFSLYEEELNRPPPSYTVDTVRTILEQEKDKMELFLILGDDSLKNLDQWKNIDELLQLTPPLFGHRVGYKTAFPQKFQAILEKAQVEIPTLEISATEIRARLKAGKYCGHLVPAPVLDYIYECHLYET